MHHKRPSRTRQPTRSIDHPINMVSKFDMAEPKLFSLLPDRRPPWKEFLLSISVQGVGLLVLAWSGVLQLEKVFPTHNYAFIQLVNTPTPVNHVPAPVRRLSAPAVARVDPTPSEAIRTPAETRTIPPPEAPDIHIAAVKAPPLPAAAPVLPRALVKTNVFSPGSSAPVTTARAPEKVQTGGFGDPNGVPAHQTDGRPVTIAQAGSFDLPAGPGYGNGSGASRGVAGVVASAGFGNGVATGDQTGKVNASRGTGLGKSGFGDAQAAVNQPHTKPTESAAKLVPAEIITKPTPTYTAEARNLRIEGEVVLAVVFEASGKLRIVRVVQGLGHGLDEAALHAAEGIRFKPAVQDGRPSDFPALVHIVFRLA